MTVLCLSATQLAAPLHAEQQHVSARPGTPNIWSMEQAHYLLSRLRANKDGLQLKLPSDSDLDPNAVNGLRLDALQSFLKVGVGFNQITGTENRLALDAHTAATARQRTLQLLADARLQEQQAREMEKIALQEATTLLQGRLARATDAAEKVSLEKEIEAKQARIEALEATVTALRAQATELRAQAAAQGANGATPTKPAPGGSTAGTETASGSASAAAPSGGAGASLPTLKPTGVETANFAREEMMKQAFQTLINQTANSFKQPRLHASQLLDNFVQMQYEIVAKQLTTLRDEVGKGQRVLFLELPTSIQAQAQRKAWFRDGGEDRLAQSWWRLKTLYLSYDKTESPCWLDGGDVTDGVQLEIGGRSGADVDDVPEFLKGHPRKLDGRRAGLALLDQQISEIERQLQLLTTTPASTPASNVADARKDRRSELAKARVKALQLEDELSRLQGMRRAEYGDSKPGAAAVAHPRAVIEAKLKVLEEQTEWLKRLRTEAQDRWTKYNDERRKAESQERVVQDANASTQDAVRQREREMFEGRSSNKVEQGRPANTTTPGQEGSDQVRKAQQQQKDARGELLTQLERVEELRKEWQEAEGTAAKQAEIVKKLQTEILSLSSVPVEALEFGSREANEVIARLETPCRMTQTNAAIKAEERRRQRQHFARTIAAASSFDELILANKTLVRINEDNLRQQQMQSRAIREFSDKLRAQMQELDSDRSPGAERRHRDMRAQQQRVQADLDESVRKEAELINARAALDVEAGRLKEPGKRREEAKTALDRLQQEEEVEGRKLQDELHLWQTRIYAEFGGPVRIQHAFRLELKENGTTANPGDRGLARAIEILPRQTALNVNATHALVKGAKITGAFQFLFGLGGKLDYERLRESYDQFLQQEVFASGFGKGNTVFGWTFGPNPGTRVLNAGTRTTYAALTVPSNATGMVVESRGCSFHQNSMSPEEEDGRPCSDWTAFSLGLPDRDTAGSFQVREVRFDKVRPGERAAVTLHGRFSPETTVLVNGRRLVQVVGLGKPIKHMDFGSTDELVADAIDGSFEFVNERNLAVKLNIPADYKHARFPRLTLISPSRSASINSALLMVNGFPKRLEEEDLLIESKPAFALQSFEVIDSGEPWRQPRRITARLTGVRMTAIERLWINRVQVAREMIDVLSDQHALVQFEAPQEALRWTLSAASGGVITDRRASSSVSIANPLRLSLSDVAVKAGSVKHDKNGKVERAELTLTGSAFSPELALDVHGATVVSQGYASPEQWHCTIERLTGPLVFYLSGAPHGRVSRSLTIPNGPAETPASPKPKAKVTEVSIQRRETEN